MNLKFDQLPNAEKEKILIHLKELVEKNINLSNDYSKYALQAANTKIKLEANQRKLNKLKEEFGIYEV